MKLGFVIIVLHFVAVADVLLASLFDAAADQRRGQPATALAKSASANA